MAEYDAVVVGSGPNGLAAAVTLARAGLSVLVVEAQPTVGGGLRSGALTRPGYVHDVGSTVQALALVSPFLRSVPLADHGVALAHPPVPYAHPLDGGQAALAHRDVTETARGLGADGDAWQGLVGPLVDTAEQLFPGVLAPARLPRHPLPMARFALAGLRSTTGLAARFRTPEAKALLAGAAAHSMLSLHKPPTAAFGLVLALTAHVGGWPVAVGGSQALADGLVSYLASLGGEVRTGSPVTDVRELPSARALLLDLTPRQVVAVAGDRLTSRYRDRLARYRYGAGVFKLDWALDGPVPWRNHAVHGAGTVHLGGTIEEISAAEDEVLAGGHPERPYVLAVQATVADGTRAPQAHHTLWAYTHVPRGSTVDMTDRVERQIERFAPGFRERVLARAVSTPADLERGNANLVGGDINGGAQDLWQLFTRPTWNALDPYATPDRSLYLCSSSTPPGGGVHGMSGYWAARSALRRVFGVRVPASPAPAAARLN